MAIEPPYNVRLTRPRNPDGTLHPSVCICVRCAIFKKLKRKQRALLLKRLGKGKLSQSELERAAQFQSPEKENSFYPDKTVDTNSGMPFNDDIGI